MCKLIYNYQKLNPEVLIWNDLHDHRSQNHHNTLTQQILLAKKGDHLVEKEVQLSIDALNDLGKGRKNWIIESNHDDALQKWADRFKPHQDHANAPYYFSLMEKKLKYPYKHMLELAMEHGVKVDYKFCDPNQENLIGKIDVGHHGHRGANGARGSASGFAKTLHRTIIGHSHSPCIKQGCTQNGVGPLEQDYNSGLTSWVCCDIIIYPNNQLSFIYYGGL